MGTRTVRGNPAGRGSGEGDRFEGQASSPEPSPKILDIRGEQMLTQFMRSPGGHRFVVGSVMPACLLIAILAGLIDGTRQVRAGLLAPSGSSKTSQANQARARFDELLSQWKQLVMRRRQANARLSSPRLAERKAARAKLREVAKESDEMIGPLVAAATQAYALNPKYRTVQAFLLQFADIAFNQDRYEQCAQVTLLLDRYGFENPNIYSLGAHAMLESGDLKGAEKFFDLAKQKEAVGRLDERYLKLIDFLREPFGREREIRAAEIQADDLPRVQLTTTQGDVTIELFENDVPNTVANIIRLVERGYYNGHRFFRVTPHFGASVGCPVGDGTGGPGYEIASEIEVDDYRFHLRGSVSMLETTSGRFGSQFFFVLRPTQTIKLNRKQCVFGRVIEGMAVITSLAPADPSRPSATPPDRIISARVLRKRDHDYQLVTLTDVSNEKIAEGKALLEAKDNEQAVLRFALAIQLDKKNTEAYLLLAQELVANEDWDRAAKVLNAATRADPTSVETHMRLGKLCMDRGQAVDASRHFRNAILLQADNPELQYQLAMSLSKQNLLDDAIFYATVAVQLQPDHQGAAELLERLRSK